LSFNFSLYLQLALLALNRIFKYSSERFEGEKLWEYHELIKKSDVTMGIKFF